MTETKSKTARFFLQLLRVVGSLSVLGVAMWLSYGHIVWSFEHWVGMKHDQAVLMPWSVDGLLMVSSVTHILFGRNLNRAAVFWTLVGRYSGMGMTLGANLLAGSYGGRSMVFAVIIGLGFAVAPFAMFVTGEILLHSAAGGNTPARRSRSAIRGAQTRKAKTAQTPPAVAKPKASNNGTRERVTPKTRSRTTSPSPAMVSFDDGIPPAVEVVPEPVSAISAN